MDFYLDPNNTYERLKEEYLQYGKLIIAVDYDDTLYDFHKKGRTYDDVINLLRRWENYSEIIIWTGNNSDKYEEINSYLQEHDIPFDGINYDAIVLSNSRKIYANAYLDDRAGLAEMYVILNKLIDKIENGEIVYEEEK